ncbi:MAG TPA: NAD-dependent epimerase/dehydratase family protein [Burkholderiales bacterium]|nr:NAD-dependent epimerase/dehydratase family protein [Burkholderiales bacterium]
MKVHVTGAGGFIGGALVAELRRAGHDVQPALAGAESVVHLAAIAHRRASREELQDVNVRLAERVAREAAAAGARFVFLSSVKVHGEASEAPFTERSPIAPGDAYAESKARAEEALHAIGGLRLAVLRPPLVYGPGVKANFLALMRAIARGWPLPLAAIDNRRSLLYVGNLVDAILRCLGAEGTYLVSDGAPVSTPQLCRELGQALGRPARLLRFPPALLPGKLAGSLAVDDRAMRERLGWRAPFTREQGLHATAAWYRAR